MSIVICTIALETNNRKWLEQMKNGQIKIGCNTNLGNTVAVEMLGYTGFDWIMIDTQHAGVNRGWSRLIQYQLLLVIN